MMLTIEESVSHARNVFMDSGTILPDAKRWVAALLLKKFERCPCCGVPRRLWRIGTPKNRRVEFYCYNCDFEITVDTLEIARHKKYSAFGSLEDKLALYLVDMALEAKKQPEQLMLFE